MAKSAKWDKPKLSNGTTYFRKTNSESHGGMRGEPGTTASSYYSEAKGRTRRRVVGMPTKNKSTNSARTNKKRKVKK